MASKFGGIPLENQPTSKFGGVPVAAQAGPPESLRQSAAQLQAQETGPFQAAAVGLGRGLVDIGRGLGLAEPAQGVEEEAFGALVEERPITAGGGQIVGQALPVAAAGLAASTVAPLAAGVAPQLASKVGQFLASGVGRTVAGSAIGAGEGAVIARGTGQDIGEAAAIGGTFGGVGALVAPALIGLGGKVIRKLTGKAPKSTVLDNLGQPTDELKKALDDAGLTFDELTEEATQTIQAQSPGANPEQVARLAGAADVDVPLTKGEVTQAFPQRRKEEVLLGGTDSASEPFRQFKLKQSQAINKALEGLSGTAGVEKGDFLETSGALIKESLEGRRNLLRTQKNQLYKEAAELAEGSGGLPVFTDGLSDIVDSADFQDLQITSPTAVGQLDGWLGKFGLIEVDADVPVEILELGNVERFRKGLQAISRADTAGASKGIIGRITGALDDELDEMVDVLESAAVAPKPLSNEVFFVKSGGRNVEVIRNPTPSDYGQISSEVRKDFPDIQPGEPTTRFTLDDGGNRYIWKSNEGLHDGIEPLIKAETGVTELGQNVDLKGTGYRTKRLIRTLKEARSTTRQLKTEFTTKDLVGELIAKKPDNFTAVVEASAVYDKIAGKRFKVENIRRLVGTLKAGGEEGAAGLDALRTNVILDLIDGGFSTKSRQIDGLNVFNPIAFRNRLDNIGESKLRAIFQDDPNTLGKLMNIDKIAKTLTPPDRATPKGSADIILQLMGRLVPGASAVGNIVAQGVRSTAGQVTTGLQARGATKGAAEVKKIASVIDSTYPGIAAALGLAATDKLRDK